MQRKKNSLKITQVFDFIEDYFQKKRIKVEYFNSKKINNSKDIQLDILIKNCSSLSFSAPKNGKKIEIVALYELRKDSIPNKEERQNLMYQWQEENDQAFSDIYYFPDGTFHFYNKVKLSDINEKLLNTIYDELMNLSSTKKEIWNRCKLN